MHYAPLVGQGAGDHYSMKQVYDYMYMYIIIQG